MSDVQGAGAAGAAGQGAGTPQPTGTGATTQVPYGQMPPAAGQGNVDIKALIPAEFKDKPYLSDVDSVEKLFKKLDGAQTLLGKPRGLQVPEANAPKEKFDEFFKAIGRPDKAEEYEFEKVEGLNYDDKFLASVKSMMHAAGVPKEMAKTLQKNFDAMQLQRIKEHQEFEKAEDAKFDTLVKPHLGEDTDKALKSSQTLIRSVLPADMAPHLDKLTPAQAAILAVVVNKFAEKYISPDKLPTGDGTGSSSSESVEALQTEARTLMAKPEYWRPDHPESQTLQKRVKELYARIGAMQGKK